MKSLFLFLLFLSPLFSIAQVKISSQREIMIGDHLLIRERIFTEEDAAKMILTAYKSRNSEYDSRIWTIKDECNKSVEFEKRPFYPLTIQTLCDYDGDGTYYKNSYSLRTGEKLLSYDLPDATEPMQIRLHDSETSKTLATRYFGFLNSDAFRDEERLAKPLTGKTINGDIFGVLYYTSNAKTIDELYFTYKPTAKESKKLEESELPLFIVSDIEVLTPNKDMDLKDNYTLYYKETKNPVDIKKEFNGFSVKLILALGEGAGDEIGQITIPVTNDRLDSTKIKFNIFKTKKGSGYLKGKFSSVSSK